MTEEEWLACNRTAPMLQHLAVVPDDRRVILLTAACLEIVRDRLPIACRAWLDLLYEVGASRADPAQLDDNWETIEWKLSELDPRPQEGGRFSAILALATGAWQVDDGSEPGNGVWEGAEAQHADLLRDIFGNPFRPVSFDPSWLTSDVLTLARGIYDERAFDRMPILADALQDAGCTNEDVLSHCRDTKQVHVRGCWVVDLLL